MLSAGCAMSPANPRLLLRYESGLQVTDVAALASRAGPGDASIVDLGRSAWVSEHVAVVRTAEKPHYHRFHDLTVSMLRGEGVLTVDQKRLAMKAGDVAHIHRGVNHFFRNTGSEPAVTFVVFSPPFDGRDTVTAEVPAGAKPQAEAPKRSWWQLWGGDEGEPQAPAQ
jgi:mannose-6-phosphate isomerase-like protein (cupin superfamily)